MKPPDKPPDAFDAIDSLVHDLIGKDVGDEELLASLLTHAACIAFGFLDDNASDPTTRAELTEIVIDRFRDILDGLF